MEELEEYIAGYVFGDGNLYYDKSRRAYRIRMYDASREHLIAIARIICKLYGVKISIYKRKSENLYVASMYSRAIHRRIVELLENLRDNPSIQFIRGLFDAEGYCYIRQRGNNFDIEIGIASKDIELLKKVQEILKKHGIGAKLVIRELKNPRRFVGYIRVYGLENTCRLYTLLNPLHSRFYKLRGVCPPSPEGNSANWPRNFGRRGACGSGVHPWNRGPQ